MVRTLFEKIPEEVLIVTTLSGKKVSFKDEAEELGADQESGEWMMNVKESEGESLSER